MMIKKAKVDQFQAVRDFYYAVIDGISNSNDSLVWEKDIYPASDYLNDSIRNGELFIAEKDETIIAAMVLNHQFNDEYKKCSWPTKADDEEVIVIHILGVHPLYMGKGFAKKMVQFAIDYACENQQKVVRLDVLKGNHYAEILYSGMGFQYVHTLQMFYDDTGWADFLLYEYPISQ